jgi:hypothetical protein
MDRIPALTRYLAIAARRSIDPGQFDCALFVAGWVDTVKGTDHTARWVGRYTSFAEGRALLRAEGLRSLRDLARRELGPEQGWMAAQPGDVALIRDGSLAFGIVGVGGHVHVLHAQSGLDVVRLDRVWGVFRP